MGASDESAEDAEAPEALGVPEPLPDLLALNLVELGTIEHPVLREVLRDLRERATRPSEMLWGFNNAL
ncbi:FxSxx-COOH cyclophane-containing RiPP peptide [Streptomyces maremycinicus]|uniref:FxSxx-COOH cyclophane-containing RiPP peptide n=1 Tax=Streptomyces maremycinicus TaxID=1679753 RepID=UPI000787E1CA|nr:FxSxx-COOH cyclophane-containing RiPP peptide [Streptomyces sp. NBRC 110468]